ncbi:hypothetical protein PHYPSEUDO_010562 [Phytophthora pseudosyringae]|uniref:Uncharacterized protein n=1 Tax=Phytophthora pseudosyringae TaxID=221518 RepID=A0A8T1VCV7_9STRA|nr:hypothetical protein PHYPSEUDO_010562 [Phytophthora pseudosyringae]
MMVALQLKLLQEALGEAASLFCLDTVDLGEGCASVDDAFYMLQVVAQNVVELLESGYDVSAIQTQCAALHPRIDGFVDVLNRQTAARYVLPQDAILQQLDELRCGMEMVSPKQVKDPDNSESTEERHQRAWANLEGSYYVDGGSCTWSELLQWGKSNESPSSYKCILMLRTFEAFMFERARRLTDDGAHDNSFSCESVQDLVTQYEQVVTQWCRLPRMTSVLTVEQRSRKLLAMWIAFCLVHERCVHAVPLCAQYNIALVWKDLQVAVLNDHAAISALQRVAKYTRA